MPGPVLIRAAAITLIAAAAARSWAADRPFLYGIGPIALDEKRWMLDKTVADRVHVDTVTHKLTGKRILFIYRDYRDVSGDDHIGFFQHLVRGPNNDLTITGMPKVKEGAVAAGVLANYEAMRLEKVVIVVRPRDVQATVYISTADNPLEDPDLVEIQKLADNTHLGR